MAVGLANDLRHRVIQVIPLIFVLLWSTGFIAGKFALPYIEPFFLLFVRMLLTLAVFALLIWHFKSQRLTTTQMLHQMVVGALVHAGYLGGVFAAIKWQMPAGITSLLVGLQPVLTAVLACTLLAERLSWRQWSGMLLGLVGVTMVLFQGQADGSFELSFAAVIAALVALVGISCGALYQKKFGQNTDLISGAFFQYLITAVLMGLLSWQFESQQITWSLELVLSLIWLVFGLSVTAILLLMYMIRQGEASKVASYFYLVPPVTAVESWLLFNEMLSIAAIFGIAVSAFGVFLVNKSNHSAK